jgi:nucleotide-binding universal stress UspA family protein
MYERVLHPTDGSDGVEVATEHAVELARRFDAPLHALFVVDTTITMGADAFSGAQYEGLRTAGEEELERVAEEAEREGVEVTTAIVEGTPAQAIVEEAADGDVIVMGTHGKTGLDRYLIGSTTEKVVRSAEVPVVTIPVHARTETGPD